MKIGMILDAIYPSDARVTNECEELIKNGHEIYLFCLSYQKNYIKSETINHIKIRLVIQQVLVYAEITRKGIWSLKFLMTSSNTINYIGSQ